MNSQATAPHQRRIIFIDNRLQGRLVAALILLETLMLAVTIAYLYGRFNTIIETNLFTIHRSSQSEIMPLLLQELAKVVVVMGIINTLALIVAHHLWVAFINSVLKQFVIRLNRIQALNLATPDSQGGEPHRVVMQLDRWRRAEAERLRALDRLIAQLSANSDEASRQNTRDKLQKCKRILQQHKSGQ